MTMLWCLYWMYGYIRCIISTVSVFSCVFCCEASARVSAAILWNNWSLQNKVSALAVCVTDRSVRWALPCGCSSWPVSPVSVDLWWHHPSCSPHTDAPSASRTEARIPAHLHTHTHQSNLETWVLNFKMCQSLSLIDSFLQRVGGAITRERHYGKCFTRVSTNTIPPACTLKSDINHF